jgi:hypothetical protein
MIRHGTALSALLLVAACAFGLAGETEMKADFFVAADGSDANPGTKDRPFASLARARDAVRELKRGGLNQNVTVLVRGGTYWLKEPLAFAPEDSGTEKFAITYAAAPGEKPVLSGGRLIAGWKKGEGEVWTAQVPGAQEGKWYFHQLWVNDLRAVRARSPNRDDKTPCWQLKGAELNAERKTHSYSFAPGQIKAWGNLEDVEAVVYGNWEITRKRFQKVDAAAGLAEMLGPHARPHEAIAAGPGRFFYLENAREFLDQPGEWYLDRKSGLLHYWPRPGEDLAKASVVAPLLTRLLEVKGTPEKPVRNLHFRGLEFAHADWTFPVGGYLGVQACHFATGTGWDKASWGRMDGAVRWDYAEGCSLRDGVIAHLGGCGIELATRCAKSVVEGNRIFDVSGNAVMLGGPKEEADVPKDCRVANNHIHACGLDYAGAVGIWTGFAQRAVIAHNEVHDLPYTGISLGWQWNPQPTPAKENVIEGNHVHNVMNRLGDGGCIYTLGFQPGTAIRGNHLHDVNRSPFCQAAPNNGMFIDEGSKGFHFENNLVYATSGEPVRFNQCQQDWHTWKDNFLGGRRGLAKGIAGQALACYGAALDVPHAAKLDPERFTVGAWVRLEDYPAGEDNRRWLVNKNGNEWTAGHYALIVSGKEAGAYLNIGGGRENCFAAVSASAPLKLKQWQHLAASYDGAALRVYVDGAEVASKAVGRKRQPGDSPLAIGRRQDGFANSAFAGLIDELRLYDRALDAAGIRALAGPPPAGKPPAEGLVQAWTFDEAGAGDADKIVEAAGLEPAYRHLLKEP